MTVTNNAAWEQPGFRVGQFEANADYSAQTPTDEPTFSFTGVVLVAATGAGVLGPFALQVASSAGVPIVGIMQNNPQVAEAADVVTFGVSKAQAGAAVSTIGTILAVNSSGLFVPATSGQYGVAMALQTAAGSGTIFSVYVDNYGKQ